MSDWYLKVGDTQEPIEFTLEDALGAVDLTGCTVQFQMRPAGTFATKVDAPGVVNPDQTNYRGRVKYEWVTGDVDTPGLFWAEWRVTWAGGKQSTFPNGENYITVEIGAGVADLPVGP